MLLMCEKNNNKKSYEKLIIFFLIGNIVGLLL